MSDLRILVGTHEANIKPLTKAGHTWAMEKTGSKIKVESFNVPCHALPRLLANLGRLSAIVL